MSKSRDLPSFRAAQVPLEGVEDLKSPHFLYRGVAPQAEDIMKVFGFTAPLRMIQEGQDARSQGLSTSVEMESL